MTAEEFKVLDSKVDKFKSLDTRKGNLLQAKDKGKFRFTRKIEIL